jgi:hypothetical protein
LLYCLLLFFLILDMRVLNLFPYGPPPYINKIPNTFPGYFQVKPEK